jgi:hypothetical protein
LLLVERGRMLTAEEIAILDLALGDHLRDWPKETGHIARGGLLCDPRVAMTTG